MDNQSGGNNQTGEGKTVADSLHGRTGGAKSRRGDVRTAEVVNDASNGNVGGSHAALADDQSAGVVARVAHLRDDGEEGWGAGEGKDESRERRGSLGKSRAPDNLVVRGPVASLGSGCGSVLNTHSNSDGEDCVCMVSFSILDIKPKRFSGTHWQT